MIVADTNLIVYLLIDGPFSDAAQAVFDRDGVWLVPSVWSFEFLNVLATSVRAGHLTEDRARSAWAHAPAFVKDTPVAALEVFDLSTVSNFATFDCYYVVLARKLNLRLVTADKKLLKAFADVAVSIEDFARGA